MTDSRIMEEEWECLIVLDACRYDYFASMIEGYFSGALEKRISPGSCTKEWCTKAFPGFYEDVTYISGNPYINSKTAVAGFDAREHFGRIVDVWEFGWDMKCGTVLPETINNVALPLIRESPDRRFMIHYLQPHAPYIAWNPSEEGFPPPFADRALAFGKKHHGNRVVEGTATILAPLLLKSNIIGHRWELREKLGLPPSSPMDATRRQHGVEGLRKAYEQNLRFVLRYIADLSSRVLADRPSRELVVTTDHGERLGENGRYSHPPGSRDPVLVEVPWFRVKRVCQSWDASMIVEDPWLPFVAKERESIRCKIRRLRESGRL